MRRSHPTLAAAGVAARLQQRARSACSELSLSQRKASVVLFAALCVVLMLARVMPVRWQRASSWSQRAMGARAGSLPRFEVSDAGLGEAWFEHFPSVAVWKQRPRDVTLVTQVDHGRLLYAGGLAARWSGPIIVAVYIADSAAATVVQRDLADMALPPRVHFVWHLALNATLPYPINACVFVFVFVFVSHLSPSIAFPSLSLLSLSRFLTHTPAA